MQQPRAPPLGATTALVSGGTTQSSPRVPDGLWFGISPGGGGISSVVPPGSPSFFPFTRGRMRYDGQPEAKSRRRAVASLLVFAKELEKAGRISKAGKGLLKGADLLCDVQQLSWIAYAVWCWLRGVVNDVSAPRLCLCMDCC